MRKVYFLLVAGVILAMLVAVALLPHSEVGMEATPILPVALTISTPSTPIPSPGEVVLDVSSELSYAVTRVCAGNAVRFRNRQPAPVILEARDHTFSSGVLQAEGEFATVLAAVGTIEVVASSPEGVGINEYRIEVVECGER